MLMKPVVIVILRGMEMIRYLKIGLGLLLCFVLTTSIGIFSAYAYGSVFNPYDYELLWHVSLVVGVVFGMSATLLCLMNILYNRREKFAGNSF